MEESDREERGVCLRWALAHGELGTLSVQQIPRPLDEPAPRALCQAPRVHAPRNRDEAQHGAVARMAQDPGPELQDTAGTGGG